MSRTFEAKPARRGSTPIMLGIVSPSGAGKTKSALRLADGFARVTPGPIVVIDTEAGRARHHADSHSFLHIDMDPPFGPDDHIAAWTEALRHKPSTIIQDSMSHEWEGKGGVLELHDEELDRMAGNDYKKRERCTMAAWIKPKAEHNRMKHFMLQQRVNWILCFRAKEKMKPVSGGQPMDLGWQPLGAEDLIYEMLLKVLIYPGGDGVPTWTSDKIGEKALMKLPGWFRDLFAKPRQLDENIGEQLARWAAGADVSASGSSAIATTSPRMPPAPAPTLTERFDACSSFAEWIALDEEAEAQWRKATPAQREKNASGRDRMASARSRARARVEREPDRQPAAPGEPSLEDQAEIARQEAALGA